MFVVCDLWLDKKFFNSYGGYDCETYICGKDKVMIDMLVNLHYESAGGLKGQFHEVSFAHDMFEHPDVNVIKKNAYCYDYMMTDQGNQINEAGLVKPPKKTAPWENAHLDLEKHVKETHDSTDSLMLDYAAYQENLAKFSPTVSPAIRCRPVFKFLCFILNDRHRNLILAAHNNSRFDGQLTLQICLHLGYRPQCLTSGTSIIRMLIEPYGIIFIDSMRYFNQSLSSLSSRFQLTETKGEVPLKWNSPDHWNVTMSSLPPVEFYLNENDSAETIQRKKEWWETENSLGKPFSLNENLMTYCRADTRLLIAAITRFSQQTFEMCSLLVGRFGQMTNWTPKSHALFSPFSRDISTLGGFVSNRSKTFLIYHARARAP